MYENATPDHTMNQFVVKAKFSRLYYVWLTANDSVSQICVCDHVLFSAVQSSPPNLVKHNYKCANVSVLRVLEYDLD